MIMETFLILAVLVAIVTSRSPQEWQEIINNIKE